jgi:phosphate transport system protein
MSSTNHIVSSYDADLRALAGRIAEMGGLAERLVGDSVTALMRLDQALAQTVIITDARVDALQRDIEDRAITLIAKRQPMARDLRDVVAALRIASDLERIGDLAKNNAKRAMALNSTLPHKRLMVGVEHMAEIALQQLKDVLDAYSARNEEAAIAVRLRDEEIDALYTSLFRELLTYMMEDPRNITQCTHLLFCAKNIERIGDHATNIAENVHYVITGRVPEDERPKGDSVSQQIELDT